MHIWLYSIVSVLVVSAVSLAGAFTLSMGEKALRRTIFLLVSVSVGALFGDALIHLLPEAFESGLQPTTVSLLVLVGILAFFVLEKFLHWRHVHGEDEETEDCMGAHDHSIKPLGPMVLISDAVHNFIDGVIVAGSYLVSVELGIATTLAVVLHEIPHEIANFGILIHSGYAKRRALVLNFVSALFAVAGAVFALLLGSAIGPLVAVILPIAAGNFLYIAGSDLVPELHKESDPKKSLVQFACILIGIGLMAALLLLE
jgi:zinc and cadmium transporter